MTIARCRRSVRSVLPRMLVAASVGFLKSPAGTDVWRSPRKLVTVEFPFFLRSWGSRGRGQDVRIRMQCFGKLPAFVLLRGARLVFSWTQVSAYFQGWWRGSIRCARGTTSHGGRLSISTVGTTVLSSCVPGTLLSVYVSPAWSDFEPGGQACIDG